jgi:hypothetical protein
VEDGDMGEIVNLRRVKRQRARDAAAEQAQENRVRHGRTGAQKAADRGEAVRRAAEHAGLRLDAPCASDEPGKDV